MEQVSLFSDTSILFGFSLPLRAQMRNNVNIGILASGTGSNADRMCSHFSDVDGADIGLIISNKPDAGVMQVAAKHNIDTAVIPDGEIERELLQTLLSADIDFVVLAGFLRMIPADVVERYSGRMVNIHPALLPEFGGKGMYGARVHRAVIEAGKKESGITIHLVNDRYDEGDIVFQARCEVTPDDTPETLAAKVHQLEHQHYPRIVQQLTEDLPSHD